MFQYYKFSLDDSKYHDSIRAHPAHYNSMRAKPILPQALIENNLIGLRPFPNTWLRSKEEWKYFRDDKKFRKRCLFETDKNSIEKVHMATLDTISNQHLVNPKLTLPYEDDVFRVLGQKRNVINKRNGFEEYSPGDKTYRSAEYSSDFFNRKTRDWRKEKFALPKKSKDSFPDLTELLDLSEKKIADVFTTSHIEFDYEQDPFMEKRDELDVVKSLDTWRPNSPLQLPFKVLDVGDKALKYRPRVTR